MKFTATILLSAGICTGTWTPHDRRSPINHGGPKVIMDNDWNPTAAGQFLMALDYGWDVLGLIGDTGNSWALQCSLHALSLLEIGALSECIPVQKGADYPLLLTPKLMQSWQELQGDLPWAGVFKPYNQTAEELGAEASGGDPNHVSKAAFKEGYPNGTLSGVHAAAWMVEQVRKYPGEVTIWSAGAMTNVALAVRLDSEFAALTNGLYVMGGYMDVNLLQTSGSILHSSVGFNQFNLKADPEAARIALSADFPKITVVSQGSNDIFPEMAWLEEVYQVQNPYTRLMHDEASAVLPLWDEATIFAALEPESILNQTSFYVTVDTSYYSPTYGNMFAYQEALKPAAQDLRQIDFVYAMNGTSVKAALKRALQHPATCL
ncbi:hypothetical protein G7054_g11124 [Neopestalotiopsis clavispora]|nr:hypothetical protein G7054_g11124 [Neopestalotiopsis clavispora]